MLSSLTALRILIATSNAGKLRDFAAAAAAFKVEIAPLPGLRDLPVVEENGLSFTANARKKAEFYSKFAPVEIVVADDSGLEVRGLGGAPGVRSARYAADGRVAAASTSQTHVDEANNQRLLRELENHKDVDRGARFVCVLAAARDGKILETFEGEVRGEVLPAARGQAGFGYDPLFLVPELGKTLAELSPEEKARVSHRGAAFRKFLEWLAPRKV